jgi:hypothetical protein
VLGDQAQLLQDRHAVVQPDFLGDQAVLDLEHRRAGEPHRLTGVGLREPTERQVGRWAAGVRPAADPLTDDVVALGDQVRGAAEREVGERVAERGREFADGIATAQWGV